MNKVGSIDIQFSGMCKGCGKADLNIYSCTLANEYKWFIRCSHENACNRMLKLARGENDVRDQTQEDA